jgi:hypothetical protein
MLLFAVGINVVVYHVIPSVQRSRQIPTTEDVNRFRDLIAQLREDLNDIEGMGRRTDALAQKKPYDMLLQEKMNGYIKFALYVAKDYNETSPKVYISVLKLCKLPTSILVIPLKKGFTVRYKY